MTLTQYFKITIQGSKASPDKMSKSIDEVLVKANADILSMNLQEFNKIKTMIKSDLEKHDDNMSLRNSRIWKEIYNYSFDFNKYRKMNKVLDDLTLEEVNDFFKQNFITNPRRVSIHIYHNKLQIPTTTYPLTYSLRDDIKISQIKILISSLLPISIR